MDARTITDLVRPRFAPYTIVGRRWPRGMTARRTGTWFCVQPVTG